MQGVYNTVTALMRIQLQSILDESCSDLARSFQSTVPTESPMFRVQFILDGENKTLRTSPTLEELQEKLEKVFNQITSVLKVKKLFQNT